MKTLSKKISIGDRFPDRQGRINVVVGFSKRQCKFPVVGEFNGVKKKFSEYYVETMKLG